MGAGSKRRATEAGISRSNLDVGDLLDDTKTSAARRSPHLSDADSGEMDGLNGNWSVAEPKSSRKKRRKIEQNPDAYPSINF